ncbi:MAG: RNA polymerase sigma-70 factor [Bacteroidota bacterium]
MNQLQSGIIRLIKEGDEKAFEIIFRTYYSRLVRFANEYVKDSEISRNLVQNAFMKLWENRTGLKETDAINGYLYTLTKNESISYLRHLKVSQKFAGKIQAEFDNLMLNLDALSDLDFNTFDMTRLELAISKILEELPERCREVFILSRIEQLKNKEIAEKLQISNKAVESNITRALKIFRDQLKDYLPAGFLVIFQNAF